MNTIHTTFSFYGTKADAKKHYEGLKLHFEVNEFEGTEEEFHSGTTTIKLDDCTEEKVREAINRYDLKGECFSVIDSEGNEIFNEEDF